MEIERQTQRDFLDLGTPWGDVRAKCREHLDGCPGVTIGTSRDFNDRLRFLVLSMVGEAGEAANVMKKMWRGDTKFHDEKHLIKEIADTANYACMLAEHLGIDLLSEQMKGLVGYERKQKKGSRPR